MFILILIFNILEGNAETTWVVWFQFLKIKENLFGYIAFLLSVLKTILNTSVLIN